jgi:hypothetical protein
MHCHWTHLGRVLSTINVSAVESRNRYVLLQCNSQQLAHTGDDGWWPRRPVTEVDLPCRRSE